MPQSVTCNKCRHVLYEGLELKPTEEIIQRTGGSCPKCGSKLVFNIQTVQIVPQD